MPRIQSLSVIIIFQTVFTLKTVPMQQKHGWYFNMPLKHMTWSFFQYFEVGGIELYSTV